MTTKERWTGLAVAAGLLLLGASCGGRQNPYRLDTAAQPAFFDGLWDGFTAALVFIRDITSPRDYQYYVHGADALYFLGYAPGAIVMGVVVLWLLESIRRLF